MKTYQEFISEAKKCWPGYKKKGTQKLFGKTYNRCVKEGKVPYPRNEEIEYELEESSSNKDKLLNAIARRVHNAPNRKERQKWKDIESKHRSRFTPPGKKLWRKGLTQADREYANQQDYDDLDTFGTKSTLDPGAGVSHITKNQRKLRKQKAMGEHPNESFEYELEEEYKERPIKRMMKKAMDIVNRPDYEGSSEDAWRHNQIIKHTLKKKGGGKQRKKAQHNIDKYWDRLDREDELGEGYELEESSSGERSGRRTRGQLTLARGRGADMTRQERTTAAIAKKAGLKGTGKYSTKDLRTTEREYDTYDSEDDMDDIGSTEQDHRIRTHSSARKAAEGERLIRKYKPAGKTPTGMTKLKTAPSGESVRRVKDLKKQMTKAGANKRGRVHSVDIMHRDSDVGKGDKDQQMERGRNFIKALKDTPKHLKAAGAKKGDTVVGKPTAVMPGEDQKTGVAKRAKLYKKVFGRKTSERSHKTGLMTGKVD